MVNFESLFVKFHCLNILEHFKQEIYPKQLFSIFYQFNLEYIFLTNYKYQIVNIFVTIIYFMHEINSN